VRGKKLSHSLNSSRDNSMLSMMSSRPYYEKMEQNNNMDVDNNNNTLSCPMRHLKREKFVSRWQLRTKKIHYSYKANSPMITVFNVFLKRTLTQSLYKVYLHKTRRVHFSTYLFCMIQICPLIPKFGG